MQEIEKLTRDQILFEGHLLGGGNRPGVFQLQQLPNAILRFFLQMER